MHNFLQINKFSNLHNGKNVFFCKTDYIFQDFQTINRLDNSIIFITGNSDYAITDDIVDKAPQNITKWYCQNAIANHAIIEPLPIGLENKYPSHRSGHGIAYYNRSIIKENLIIKTQYKKPTIFDKIYANFNVNTNIYYRNNIKNICINQKHIMWEEPSTDLQKYYTQLAEYQLVLCPVGNGIDTHRLWEVLYCGRTPITIKTGKYKIYDLYKKFPIILLDDIEQLLDMDFIINQYQLLLYKNYEKSLLNSIFWENLLRENYA